jgi:LemA protein
MTALYGAAIFMILLAVYSVALYNKLVVSRQNVKEAWSSIETEMQRRFDLIPNLVETVKGYASHERGTLEAVIQARNSAISNISSPEALAGSQNVLTGALSKLMALSEAYPDLKANANFNQLQAELGETETRISQARRFYNANVRDFNSTIESFPNVLFAGLLGFKQQQMFGIDNPDAYNAVKVNFDSAAPSKSISQSSNSTGSQSIKLNQNVDEKIQ